MAHEDRAKTSWRCRAFRDCSGRSKRALEVRLESAGQPAQLSPLPARLEPEPPAHLQPVPRAALSLGTPLSQMGPSREHSATPPPLRVRLSSRADRALAPG